MEEVRQLTGFEFRTPPQTPETPALTAEERRLLYGPVKEKLARVYPQFAARLQKSEQSIIFWSQFRRRFPWLG